MDMLVLVLTVVIEAEEINNMNIKNSMNTKNTTITMNKLNTMNKINII